MYRFEWCFSEFYISIDYFSGGLEVEYMRYSKQVMYFLPFLVFSKLDDVGNIINFTAIIILKW